jgi:division protein CdvB (Snf7/Vps24/ESCRT-III family)
MTSFDKTWARQETQSVTGKLREAVKPQGALKPRIQTAVNKLQVQISKMDSMLTKLQERDQQIFQRIVTSMQQQELLLQCSNMIPAQVRYYQMS